VTDLLDAGFGPCSVAAMARAPKTADVVAEMVANVLSVSVATGDRIAAGDTVVLLESMKMEIPVLAEHGGTVTAVKVGEGDVVQEGDVLISIDL
jgi:acetyl-CoA carboxylase biotin carboxyl carrier protein